MASLTKAKESSSTAALLAGFQKEFGEAIGTWGGKAQEVERIPTGMFEFDSASGGGFPRGRISLVYGPESSGKTNLVLKAIANHQAKWPGLKCVFVAVEPFDAPWATKMGVNTDDVLVLQPTYAEQACDIVEKLMLEGTDVGLIALDSIAAMASAHELNSSADKTIVGGTSIVINRMFKKIGVAQNEAEKEGRAPTFIAINQIRSKVGIVYGNPETKPGGKQQDFSSSMTVRVAGNNIMDPKVNKVMPVRKEVTFIIKKWKCPILSVNGKFEMVTYPHKGLVIGQCDDAGTIQAYLEDWGEWTKDKKGWKILDTLYKTQAEFFERFYQDSEFGNALRQAVVAKLMTDNEMLVTGGGVDVPVETESE